MCGDRKAHMQFGVSPGLRRPFVGDYSFCVSIAVLHTKEEGMCVLDV